MYELGLFLKNYKWQSLWIILSSLIINILALSSALYVIQVFNRYLNYKLDSTLFALTLGVCIAFTIEIALRFVRGFLINKVSTVNYREITLRVSNFFRDLTHMDGRIFSISRKKKMK